MNVQIGKGVENMQDSSFTDDKKYNAFKSYLKHVADKFRLWDPNATYRLISHLDADGISAAAIMIKLLTLMNRKYTVSIIPYLDRPTLEKLKKEEYEHYIFTDLGSGSIENIKEIFDKEFVLILDHHEFNKENTNQDYDNVLQELKFKVNESPKILHANPHMFDIDGGNEISGSGVTFLFSRKIHRDIDKVAHIAIIGAIGDVQENHGFKQLNNEILEIAKAEKSIKVIQGLRLFGVQTRPLHKVLEYCSEPYLQGVTGNESGAIQFLYNIGINPRSDNGYKKLIHLSDNDMQKLVTGIVLKMQDNIDSHKIVGNVYIIKNERKESPTRDAKEFATLLNACGRLQKASLGIGVCLNISSMKKKALELLSSYKTEIVKSLKWVEGKLNGKKKSIHETNSGEVYVLNNAIIINSKTDIRPTMIGTITSIFSRSNLVKQKMFLLGLSRYEDGNTKISLRSKNNKEDLKALLEKTVSKLQKGETGGHQKAAGAIFPTMEEPLFLEQIMKEFENIENKIKVE